MKLQVLPVLIGLTTVLTAACTGHKDVSALHDHLVVAVAAAPTSLDPRYASDAVGSRLTGLLYRGLVRLNDHLKIEGDVASNWTLSSNQLTLRIKPIWIFADGQPLTSKDLEYTFREYLNPQNPYASSLVAIKKVDVEGNSGALNVILHLRHPSASLLHDLSAIKILREQKNGVPLGLGPYELQSQEQSEIRLRSRPHSSHLPLIPHIVFKVIRDDNTRFLKLIKGEIDILQSDLPLSKVAEVEKQSHLKVQKFPGLSMTYLLLNTQDPHLKDKELRRALALALNREDIVHHKLAGLARLATSLLTPENPYFDKSLRPISQDLDAAQKLLKNKIATNWVLSLKTSNNQTAIENGRVLAHQFKKLGFKVDHQSFEWGTYYSDIQKGRFQMATMKWVGSSDPDLYRLALHSREVPPGRNRGRYKNAEFDRIVDLASRTLDEKKRHELYLKAQKIVFEDLPYIPLWYEMEVAITHKRVQNYRPRINGDYLNFVEVSKNDSP